MARAGHRISWLAGASALALLGTATETLAGAFGLREQGAAGQGMSFAGVASGSGGLSSMYWNPATITMAPGWNSYSSVSLIDLDAKIRAQQGTSPLLGNAPSGQLGELAAVPSSYASYQINDQFWVGMASNAPYGLVTKPNDSWAGQIYARTSRIFSVNFNPILGYKVNDWLSIGVGPTIEYITIKLKRATSFLPTAPSAELRGDDLGFGWTAGMTLKPFDGTTIGVGYRSSINHSLEGTISNPANGTVTPIRSNLNTPELVTVGLTQAITHQFRINAGYEFSNWSRLGTVAQVADGGPLAGLAVNSLPLRYKDGHFASFGVEYDVDPSWTVRAGGAYEWSPVREAVRSPAVPDANRVWASGGLSYRWSDKITVDLAYSHVFADKAKINIVAGNPALVSAAIPRLGVVQLPFVGEVQGSVNIFSAALRYRWDDPKVAQPAAFVTR